MKKYIALILAGAALLAGCQNQQEAPVAQTEVATAAPETETVTEKDSNLVDLTALSSTMVYSEVFYMMMEPESYMDKTIKMRGIYYLGRSEIDDAVHHFAVVEDAEACCQQGLEFALGEAYSGSVDYPAEGAEIEVVGTFKSYQEDGQTYYYVDAEELQVVS